MILTTEALRIDLVDVFGPRWPRGEPGTLGDDLEAADGRVIPRRVVEHAFDRFAGEAGMAKLPGDSRASRVFCFGVAAAWTRRSAGSPNSWVNAR